MTETEFIMRDQSGPDDPCSPTTALRFWVVDGMLVLVFLAVFLGLVFLLSK